MPKDKEPTEYLGGKPLQGFGCVFSPVPCLTTCVHSVTPRTFLSRTDKFDMSFSDATRSLAAMLWANQRVRFEERSTDVDSFLP